MGSSSRLILLLTTPLSLLHPRPYSHFRLARLSLSLSTPSLSTLSRPSLLPVKATTHHHRIRCQSTASGSSNSTLKEDNFGDSQSQHSFSPNPRVTSHPWPEWSHLVHALSTAGYFDQRRFIDGIDDEYVAYENLSEEFVGAARACLAFARNRSDILGSLSRRDIEVIVENGTPFLFKSALDSSRRMRSFLGSGRTNVLESGKVEMVDLMKYLLSYASNPSVSSERNNLYNRDHIESSVRNLLTDLAEMSSRAPMSNLSAPEQYQVSEVHGQIPRPFGQNIEMKRGDWICPKCTFMNFARNNKCLECEEPRPKRQLTGGEWECPQCDFFNYGRNTVCLRCDCRRPGEVSFGTVNPRPAYNGDYASKADVDSRLAANEEKAQRWFTKVSQQNNVSDLPDEDFPEIMPLRKGENRFVVSTRKTPLERRLENSQYQRSSGNASVTEGNTNSHQVVGANRDLDASINRSLDQILGPKSPKTDGGTVGSTLHPPTRSGSLQFEPPRGNNFNFVPFVPLPADKFANKTQDSEIGDSEKAVTKGTEFVPSKSGDQMGSIEFVKSGESIVEDKDEPPRRNNFNFVSFVPLPADKFAKKPQDSEIGDSEKVVTKGTKSVPSKSGDQMGSVESVKSGERIVEDKDEVQARKPDRWFKRVAELHDVPDLASSLPHEDFSETMPMRKGENQFLISKKKDRSLTSPTYKRQMAMEQSTNSKFVPFVPFPPDYFTKKDQKPQQNINESTVNVTNESSSNTNNAQTTETQQTRTGFGDPNKGNHPTQNSFNSQNVYSHNNSSTRYPVGPPGSENLTKNSYGSQTISDNNRKDTNLVGENKNVKSSGWTGKSLEGSAVKEPDPLDMSEEAKAERWFRRVAQIKDISELSQIPDEDFPSIMPMRKGVNRFVVSKRKTPLERRLTSPQYRRNLPVVSSDPPKNENDGN